MDQKQKHVSGKIVKCFPPETRGYEQPKECATVGYSIIGKHSEEQETQVARIHKVMDQLADANGLKKDKDVKYFHAPTAAAVSENFVTNANQTLMQVVWCLDVWEDSIASSSKK